MQHNDFQLLNQVISWLKQGQQVTLFTVISTWGSSPRPPGSLLAINAEGQYVGSVSGGCVEEDLVERSLSGEFNSLQVISYDGKQNTQRPLMLPCNGQLKILAEPQLQLTQLQCILKKLEQQQSICRRVCLNTTESSLHSITSGESFSYRENTVFRLFGNFKKLILIGNGEIARHLSQLAHISGYSTIICDPREQQIDKLSDKNISFSSQMPDDLIRNTDINSTTAIVTLTHDPRIDDMALMEALCSPAFYIGALGSQRSASLRRQRLQEMQLNEEQISRLHGPAGLNIGSHTPAEIAISIMAEIIAISHQPPAKNAI